MNSQMDEDQRLAHHGLHCQRTAKKSRPRHLHQSTLNLGDAAPCYTTTHNQSYSGRSADGRPLIFHLIDPSFPSRHHAPLDHSKDTAPLQRPLQSHSHEVHGPQHITPRTNPKEENWARHRSGRAIRELTNPRNPTEYCTTYKTEHTLPLTDSSPQPASGRPTRWHQYNILTGEQTQTAGPGKPRRRSGDKLLWAARRRETDCCALRLY